MRINSDKVTTKMSKENILEQIFPTQDKYREITYDILEMFSNESNKIEGRHELEVSSVVSKLQEKGHNRHTVYKLLNQHLVPMGIVNWKKFEGSLQLSKRFGNALRNFSISWKNLVDELSEK